MDNRIDVSIAFSYKGETHSPAATLDLDAMMSSAGGLSDLHQYLAQQNNIDTYSYLYEVMEAHDIDYTNATGLAAQCLVDGQFDMHAFECLWHEANEVALLTDIAREHLGVTDLELETGLKQALLAAYRLGKTNGNL